MWGLLVLRVCSVCQRAQVATGRSGSACACVFRAVLLACVWFLGAVLVSACAWGLGLALVRATALPMFGETLSLGDST